MKVGSSFMKWHDGRIGTAERSDIVSDLLYPSITVCPRPNRSMIEKEAEGYTMKFPIPKRIDEVLYSFQYSQGIGNRYDNTNFNLEHDERNGNQTGQGGSCSRENLLAIMETS